VKVKKKQLSSEEFATIKNKLEYKYVFESGNNWYFIKRFPKYLAKNDRRAVVHYPKYRLTFESKIK
jgi:hypothetical protein